jgi:hypothetical protein
VVTAFERSESTFHEYSYSDHNDDVPRRIAVDLGWSLGTTGGDLKQSAPTGEQAKVLVMSQLHKYRNDSFHSLLLLSNISNVQLSMCFFPIEFEQHTRTAASEAQKNEIHTRKDLNNTQAQTFYLNNIIQVIISRTCYDCPSGLQIQVMFPLLLSLIVTFSRLFQRN